MTPQEIYDGDFGTSVVPDFSLGDFLGRWWLAADVWVRRETWPHAVERYLFQMLGEVWRRSPNFLESGRSASPHPTEKL